MRTLAAALLILTAFAGAAQAQTGKPPRRLRPPPTRPAAAPPPVRVAPPSYLPGAPGPAQPLRAQSPVAPAPFTPAARAGSEAAPQCRTRCAVQRYQCLSGEGGPCDERWSRCVVGCRSSAGS